MSRVRRFPFFSLAPSRLTFSPSVWRTSTAEPTRNGIIWTYEKDVTRFSPLFAKRASFSFLAPRSLTHLFPLNSLTTPLRAQQRHRRYLHRRLLYRSHRNLLPTDEGLPLASRCRPHPPRFDVQQERLADARLPRRIEREYDCQCDGTGQHCRSVAGGACDRSGGRGVLVHQHARPVEGLLAG